jgi:formiminoglutamase
MRIPVNNLSNSGTSFYQIAQHCLEHQWPFHYLCIGIQKENNSAGLFQTAREHNAKWIEASDVHMIRLKELKRQINQFLDSVGYVYLSFCLDVFHASVAPGVSAVNPLGLYSDIVMNLTKHIFQSSKVICMDIAELNPLYDIDSRTARLAASLIFNVMEWRIPGIR